MIVETKNHTIFDHVASLSRVDLREIVQSNFLKGGLKDNHKKILVLRVEVAGKKEK